jgi:hypothetical protein
MAFVKISRGVFVPEREEVAENRGNNIEAFHSTLESSHGAKILIVVLVDF